MSKTLVLKSKTIVLIDIAGCIFAYIKQQIKFKIMETKFTKGEWINACDATGHSVFTKYDLICRTNNRPTEKQAEANAKLIAAAPDLLEALETLTNYCLLSGYIDMIVEKPHIQNALLAIKKATE